MLFEMTTLVFIGHRRQHPPHVFTRELGHIEWLHHGLRTNHRWMTGDEMDIRGVGLVGFSEDVIKR